MNVRAWLSAAAHVFSLAFCLWGFGLCLVTAVHTGVIDWGQSTPWHAMVACPTSTCYECMVPTYLELKTRRLICAKTGNF